MALEQAVGDRLRNDPQLTALLTEFAGEPAVFEREAPDDTSPGWRNGVQFPRIIYLLDRSPGMADILTGSLHVTIWARDTTGEASLEAVVARVHQLLDNAAMYAAEDGLATLSAQPQVIPLPARSEALRVLGLDLIYRVQAYPPNQTYEPDPIASLNRWSDEWLDNRIKVTPGSWAPTDQAPALYWRMTRAVTRPEDLTWWGFWVEVDMSAHVLAQSAYARGVWARYVADVLRLPKMRNIRMGDGSPLRIMQVEQIPTNSAQTVGQITLKARFGVLSRLVPLGLDTPPNLPGGDIVPPPVIQPPQWGDPLWTPGPEYVSSVDTGEPLEDATFVLVPDVDQLQQPPSTG
jgi:hypothetical protein